MMVMFVLFVVVTIIIISISSSTQSVNLRDFLSFHYVNVSDVVFVILFFVKIFVDFHSRYIY